MKKVLFNSLLAMFCLATTVTFAQTGTSLKTQQNESSKTVVQGCGVDFYSLYFADWGGGEAYLYLDTPVNVDHCVWSIDPVKGGEVLSTYGNACNIYGLWQYTHYTITVTAYDSCGNSKTASAQYYNTGYLLNGGELSLKNDAGTSFVKR